MRLLPAVLIATATGGIAISYEIVWLRTFSFAMQSWADSFGLLLGAYLAGLAIGAYVAGIYCRRRPADKAIAETGIMTLLGGVLLTANAAAFMVVPAMAACAGLCWDVRNTDLAMVAVATALLGMILPLIAHAALAPDRRRAWFFLYLCGQYRRLRDGRPGDGLLVVRRRHIAADRISARLVWSCCQHAGSHGRAVQQNWIDLAGGGHDRGRAAAGP